MSSDSAKSPRRTGPRRLPAALAAVAVAAASVAGCQSAERDKATSASVGQPDRAGSSVEPGPAETRPRYAVGFRQFDFVDRSSPEGDRHLALKMFYPAVQPGPSAAAVKMPLYTAVNVYPDLEPVAGGRHPLVLFSHGAGSNGGVYAWFAEALAARGYVVAAMDHYHANTYDNSVLYLRNKLWQRPRDLTLAIDRLLADPFWGPQIDASGIGVAGHSQGGFTALWLGGARVNAEKFVAYQSIAKNDPMVPPHLRDQMELNAAPALDVADARVKAVFAMAPGMVQDFGMDAGGLRQVDVPTYITVGSIDTTTPVEDNAAFAAKNITGAQLDVIPGVGHEIFTNECSQLGRDNYPDSCNDPSGIDRAAIHRDIVDAALKFFGAHLGGR